MSVSGKGEQPSLSFHLSLSVSEEESGPSLRGDFSKTAREDQLPLKCENNKWSNVYCCVLDFYCVEMCSMCSTSLFRIRKISVASLSIKDFQSSANDDKMFFTAVKRDALWFHGAFSSAPGGGRSSEMLGFRVMIR